MDWLEGLVGAARERHPQPMDPRERAAVGGMALLFLVAAGALVAFVPSERDADPLLVAVLVLGYALISRVEFEIGSGMAVPEALLFVPLLFLAPLPWVPLLVAVAFCLSRVPEFVRREKHVDRWLYCLSDAWFAVGAVAVLGWLDPGEPHFDQVGVYALAFAAQLATGTLAALTMEWLGLGQHPMDTLRSAVWAHRVDAVFWPVGLMAAVAAEGAPYALVAVGPLVWLLTVFSRERKQRHAAALELSRAYRGTVMLLADVVESDDCYTAEHCRSVVDLVTLVADELGVSRQERQELEFAALLHDVGKIAIPKEILNKPGKLTDEEFELMKTHTVEGQVLLDRIGGLLGRVGRIVRSCHERWDGNGYPDGLAGEQIPLPARIVFTCDAYNAMTTNRPYRKAMSRAAALAELRANSGTQFDPQVVDALCAVAERGETAAHEAPVELVRAIVAGPLPLELSAR